MTDFERNYFGTGPRPLPSTSSTESSKNRRGRGVLVRSSSHQEPEPGEERELSNGGRTSSLRRPAGVRGASTSSSSSAAPAAVKKEVNFLSPTKSDAEPSYKPHQTPQRERRTSESRSQRLRQPEGGVSLRIHQTRQLSSSSGADEESVVASVQGDGDWNTAAEAISYYSDSTASNSVPAPLPTVTDNGPARRTASSWSLSSNCQQQQQQARVSTTLDDSRFGTIRSVQSECRTSSTSQLNRSGSLRRIKGRSNQSLCSCDAETEVRCRILCRQPVNGLINGLPLPQVALRTNEKPLIEYSADRSSSRGQHTYTCEQNARIRMRLEKEQQLKKALTSSTGKLVSSKNVPPSRGVSELVADWNSSPDCCSFGHGMAFEWTEQAAEGG